MQLLVDLHSYGCMLRGQIQQLFFGSVQRTNTRLRQLFDARYLNRAELGLPSCVGAPTGCQTAYLIGPAAIPIVAAQTGQDTAEIRRMQRHGTPAYLLHTIEIVNFRLAVEAAVRACADVRLERFLPERLCQQTYDYRQHAEGTEAAGTKWRTEVYKPDAVLLLAWDGGQAGYALEIDRGHTSSSEWLIKSRIHARYASSGLFARRYGRDKAATLCVTTSSARRDNLRALLARDGNDRVKFSTFGEVQAGGVLGPIWRTVTQDTPRTLLATKDCP